mmetsp:Transcript_103282/g.166496  ORF Transcript_103282/g.166496 Transcript_103282/m.166496 type:complete len:138 (+) Transcript_103282:38-451(+)
MFSDVLLMKTQLFHTIWPAVDIIPMASFADASGADASVNGANYYPVSSESTVAWNYGANFGGKTGNNAYWTSGADSITAGSYDKDTPTTNGGMYGVYMVADPSYGTLDGGYGNSTNYPQNGNSVISMCHDSDMTCMG